MYEREKQGLLLWKPSRSIEATRKTERSEERQWQERVLPLRDINFGNIFQPTFPLSSMCLYNNEENTTRGNWKQLVTIVGQREAGIFKERKERVGLSVKYNFQSLFASSVSGGPRTGTWYVLFQGWTLRDRKIERMTQSTILLEDIESITPFVDAYFSRISFYSNLCRLID